MRIKCLKNLHFLSEGKVFTENKIYWTYSDKITKESYVISDNGISYYLGEWFIYFIPIEDKKCKVRINWDKPIEFINSDAEIQLISKDAQIVKEFPFVVRQNCNNYTFCFNEFGENANCNYQNIRNKVEDRFVYLNVYKNYCYCNNTIEEAIKFSDKENLLFTQKVKIEKGGY